MWALPTDPHGHPDFDPLRGQTFEFFQSLHIGFDTALPFFRGLFRWGWSLVEKYKNLHQKRDFNDIFVILGGTWPRFAPLQN